MKKYFTIAVAALALAACDKNNDDFNIDNTKDTPITIASAGVAELIATRSAETNPLVGTSTSPATMGVFVTGGNEAKYNATNVKWTHDGTSWSGASTMLYEGTGSQQKIYAYSPYSETTATADGTITVTVSDQSDWLVATSTDVTGSSVSLTMTHALAKLVLKPTFGTDVDDQTNYSVKVGGMYASGTLNIADNTWALSENPTTTELTMTNNELLVIPMAQCTSFPITVVTGDNRTFSATIDLTGESIDNTLAAGTQYNIYLQVGQDKVTVDGITASPWTSQDGGELETY